MITVHYVSEFLTLASIHFFFLITPGVSFAMILRNVLLHGRKTGFYIAAGLGIATLTHVMIAIFGLRTIQEEAASWLRMLRYFGSTYIVYLGLKALIHAHGHHDALTVRKTDDPVPTPLQSILQGYLTNLSNPSVFILLISLYTTLISVQTPLTVKLLYGGWFWFVNTAWFVGLSFLFATKGIRKKLEHYMYYVETISGAILVLLGMKMFFS